MNGPHQGAGGEPLKSGKPWREIRRRRAEQDGPDFEAGVARERARMIEEIHRAARIPDTKVKRDARC